MDEQGHNRRFQGVVGGLSGALAVSFLVFQGGVVIGSVYVLIVLALLVTVGLRWGATVRAHRRSTSSDDGPGCGD